jgi:hypothetical protein
MSCCWKMRYSIRIAIENKLRLLLYTFLREIKDEEKVHFNQLWYSYLLTYKISLSFQLIHHRFDTYICMKVDWQEVIIYLSYYLHPFDRNLFAFILVYLLAFEEDYHHRHHPWTLNCSSIKDKTNYWLTHDDFPVDPEATAVRSIIFSSFYS